MNGLPFSRRGPVRLLVLSVLLSMLLGLDLRAGAAQPPPTFTGTLAITGVDGNIYRLAAGDPAPLPLTSDAIQGVRQYAWPTWSTDGRLAFFGQEVARLETQQSILLRVFITPPDDPAPSLAYESNTETLTYAYWAPGNCPASAGCRDLAILTTTPGGLSVLRVRDEAPDFAAQTIGQGQPFYYSYSPDGSRMIWQRFGRQLDLYDAAADRVLETLPDQAGFFQAPMWSPVDDRLLFSTIDASGMHDLVIADGQNRQVIAANQRGLLAFAWSPDGRFIAYKRDYGELHVVDSATGEESTRSIATGILAFFWSPDSRKLAYLTVSTPEVSPQVQAGPGGRLAAPARQARPALFWHVIDLARHEEWTSLEGFLPTRDMLYFLSFFDQFAQSHRLWSPDSRYLVYAELTSESRQLIHLLDTNDPAAWPLTLTEGQIGIWSYH